MKDEKGKNVCICEGSGNNEFIYIFFYGYQLVIKLVTSVSFAGYQSINRF